MTQKKKAGIIQHHKGKVDGWRALRKDFMSIFFLCECGRLKHLVIFIYVHVRERFAFYATQPLRGDSLNQTPPPHRGQTPRVSRTKQHSDPWDKGPSCRAQAYLTMFKNKIKKAARYSMHRPVQGDPVSVEINIPLMDCTAKQFWKFTYGGYCRNRSATEQHRNAAG